MIRTRLRTTAGNNLFKMRIERESWDEKASLLVKRLDNMMNEAFPIKTKKIKNMEDPWISDHIRNKRSTRKGIFDR